MQTESNTKLLITICAALFVIVIVLCVENHNLEVEKLRISNELLQSIEDRTQETKKYIDFLETLK